MRLHGVGGGRVILVDDGAINLAVLLKSSSEETAGKIIRWATIIAVILIGQKRLFQKTVMACFVNEAMEGIVDFDHLLDIAFFSVKLHMLEDGGDILNFLFGYS